MSNLLDLQSAWAALSPTLQHALAEMIRAAAGTAGGTDVTANLHLDDWLTSHDAARMAGVDPVAIFRAVECGNLQSNGATGRNRRIHPACLSRWMILRKFEPESPRASVPPPTQSETFEERRMALLRERLDREHAGVS